MEWILLAQDREQWWDVLKQMKLSVEQNYSLTLLHIGSQIPTNVSDYLCSLQLYRMQSAITLVMTVYVTTPNIFNPVSAQNCLYIIFYAYCSFFNFGNVNLNTDMRRNTESKQIGTDSIFQCVCMPVKSIFISIPETKRARRALWSCGRPLHGITTIAWHVLP